MGEPPAWLWEIRLPHDGVECFLSGLDMLEQMVLPEELQIFLFLQGDSLLSDVLKTRFNKILYSIKYKYLILSSCFAAQNAFPPTNPR
jgi:hypothetical protein